MIYQRIGFSDLFKNKKPKSIKEYLSEIDLDILYELIAFYSVNTNFNENDFEDSEFNIKNIRNKLFDENSIIINRPAILYLFNLYLKNKIEIDTIRTKESKNLIIESILYVNDILNKNQKNYFSDDTYNNVENILDFIFYNKFENSEFDRFKDDKIDIFKLAYCVIYRFNKLIDFLQLTQNLHYKDELVRHFNLENTNELKY